jgi:hypothetical protein
MNIQSCMGGWCRKRERCPNYHAASESQVPDERICAPGRDGEARWDVVIPINTQRLQSEAGETA